MIYRMRIYQAIPDKLPEFHRFFNEHLLPIQVRHGARLVGRWETDDGRVVAIWEYDDRDAYQRIDRAVRGDPASTVAREAQASDGPLYTTYDQTLMSATLVLPWPTDHPVPVAGAIVRRGDEILLVRPHEEQLHWLISGYLEAWESVEEAAVREVREETGLDVEIERMVGSYSCRSIGKNLVFAVCVARPVGGELRIGAEIADARWFPIDALPPWPADSPAAQAVADLRAAQGQ
ncbi:MAG: NUDIX domain-containing protein [Candidatus Limnocylindria bacterium]